MAIDFKTAFTRIMGRQVSNNLATNALQHLILPVLIGFLGVLSPTLWAYSPYASVGSWIGLLVIYTLVWWKSHPTYFDAYQLLIQKKQDDDQIEHLEERLETLRDVLDDLSFKNITAFAMRGMSVSYVKQLKCQDIDKDFFDEMLSDLLAPFYLSGDAIFGFEISEKWSISVYLHDRKSSNLQCVWRRTAPTHPSADRLGRTWLVGEGHVGKAFLDRKPILTGNANDEAVSQLCRARDSRMADYDGSTYVSFASVPITVNEDDDSRDPYGVLVVTSDHIDRLSEESLTEILMHVAETIAVTLELSEADTDCVLHPNQDIHSVSGEKKP